MFSIPERIPGLLVSRVLVHPTPNRPTNVNTNDQIRLVCEVREKGKGDIGRKEPTRNIPPDIHPA